MDPRKGDRWTAFVRCQRAAPGCHSDDQISCIDQGGKPVCLAPRPACAAFDCGCAGSLCGAAECTDLPGEAIACAGSGPPATCQGVLFERPEGTFCVVADDADFPCPVDAPARSSHGGTALCRATTTPPPAIEDADALAMEALQTGLLLAPAAVEAIALRPKLTASSGVLAGSRVAVDLSLRAPVLLTAETGVLPGGAQPHCQAAVHHVSQRVHDHTLDLGVWTRVTCGEARADGFGGGAVSVAIVAPAPGIYRLRGERWGPLAEPPGRAQVLRVGAAAVRPMATAAVEGPLDACLKRTLERPAAQPLQRDAAFDLGSAP